MLRAASLEISSWSCYSCFYSQDPPMKDLILLLQFPLLCLVSADIRRYSCYKDPVLGCVDRQSCHLEPGQKCLQIMCALIECGFVPNFDVAHQKNLVGGAFNQTIHKLGLNCNTTCCEKDNCNNPAHWSTPALVLIFLTSLAGLGLWLLHWEGLHGCLSSHQP